MNALWKSLVGTMKGIVEDDCHGLATQIAYHWIYALFPGLFVMVALVTAVGSNPNSLSVLGLLVERATPGETRSLVDATLVAIAEDSGPRVITQAELLANATDVDGPGLTATGLTISLAR